MSDKDDKGKDKKFEVHAVAVEDKDEAHRAIEEEVQRMADNEEDGIALAGRMTKDGPEGQVILSKRLREDRTAKLPPVPPLGELDEIREMPAAGLVCMVDALKKVALLYAERKQVADALEAVRQMRLLMTLTEEKVREERAKAGVEEGEPCDCANCVGRRVMALATTSANADADAEAAGVKPPALAALEAWTPSGPAN